jgi:hypothetical protein
MGTSISVGVDNVRQTKGVVAANAAADVSDEDKSSDTVTSSASDEDERASTSSSEPSTTAETVAKHNFTPAVCDVNDIDIKIVQPSVERRSLTQDEQDNGWQVVRLFISSNMNDDQPETLVLTKQVKISSRVSGKYVLYVGYTFIDSLTLLKIASSYLKLSKLNRSLTKLRRRRLMPIARNSVRMGRSCQFSRGVKSSQSH